uniref:Molybdenum cofactor sulfurase n=1 Tax=Anthurium amnicola TaxID=1678845 RepID=A0A1D1ZL91_9ARAE
MIRSIYFNLICAKYNPTLSLALIHNLNEWQCLSPCPPPLSLSQQAEVLRNKIGNESLTMNEAAVDLKYEPCKMESWKTIIIRVNMLSSSCVMDAVRAFALHVVQLIKGEIHRPSKLVCCVSTCATWFRVLGTKDGQT